MDLPDVVTHPPAGHDEVGRVLAAQVNEDPIRGLGGILTAPGGISRIPDMPRAGALRLDLDGNPALSSRLVASRSIPGVLPANVAA